MYISRDDPLKESPFKGSVISISSDEIGVAFENDFEAENGLWRCVCFYRLKLFIKHS